MCVAEMRFRKAVGDYGEVPTLWDFDMQRRVASVAESEFRGQVFVRGLLHLLPPTSTHGSERVLYGVV